MYPFLGKLVSIVKLKNLFPFTRSIFTDIEICRMNRLITPVNRLATGLVPKRVTVQSRTLLSMPKMVKT